MPRHVLDDSERLFLEMARLEQAAAQGGIRGGGMTAADLAEAAAEAHQERGAAGEADEEEIDPPGWKEPHEPGGDEPNRHEFLYYDAQTGQIVEALFAPDVRRWYRLVEDAAAAQDAFEEGEFPLIFDAQMSDEEFVAMPAAERDAMMGGLHWEQYGRPGAPLLEDAEQLQRAQGWRSSAVTRPVQVASMSTTPVTARLAGQPGLPTFAERPFEPRPAAQDPLLEGLKGPLFPLEGAQRMLPRSVTDIEGLDRQLEPDRLGAGSWWPEAPKPNELLTPRTGEILDELDRQERMNLPEPTEMAGLVPLGEYLRRLTG